MDFSISAEAFESDFSDKKSIDKEKLFYPEQKRLIFTIRQEEIEVCPQLDFSNNLHKTLNLEL